MNIEEPIVSVVIPTVQGREALLKRAAASVEVQTYPNIETIVVNEGLSAPEQRNIGVERAHGDFIAFLDDDDEWMPEKIEKQMRVMIAHPRCPLVVSFYYEGSTDRMVKLSNVITFKELVRGFRVSPTSGFLCRKSFLNDVGGFDLMMPSAQEYDLAVRLAMKGDGTIRCVGEPLFIRHSSEEQISTNWRKKIQGVMRFYAKYHCYYHLVDHAKTVGLLAMFFGGYLVGPRIYGPLNRLKRMYEHAR